MSLRLSLLYAGPSLTRLFTTRVFMISLVFTDLSSLKSDSVWSSICKCGRRTPMTSASWSSIWSGVWECKRVGVRFCSGGVSHWFYWRIWGRPCIRRGHPCKSLKSLDFFWWTSGQSSAHPLSIEVSLVPCALCLLRLILLYYTQGVQKSTPNYQKKDEKKWIFWLTFWIGCAILKA